MEPQEFRDRLKGPGFPIPAFFTDTGTWATPRVVEFANWAESVGIDRE
jgi:hypothetical protein